MKPVFLAAASIIALAAAQPAAAQSAKDVVRIGILNDQSGIYSDYQGPGSVIAARMAIADYGGKVAGRTIELVVADHQNKTDIGAAQARRWLEQDGVDVIVDVPNSAIALAINDLVRDRNKVFLAVGGATDKLTGERCSPNTVQWVSDTWANATSVARAVVAQGGKSWFFITADYAFGHDLEKSAAEAVRQAGGTVVGAARPPLGNQDFTSFLLQAQASKAAIIGLANAGGDTTNVIKQAAEFQVANAGQRLAGLMFQVNSVHALGLSNAQGLLTVSPFYWDMDDGTRAFSRKFAAQHSKGSLPNEYQAGAYSAVLHYLKAIEAVKDSADGKAVVAKMKQLPTDDPLFGKGTIRIDGRKMHPMHLFRIKTPAESKAPWDYFEKVHTVPAEEAFRPLNQGNCPLVTAAR